jgi:tetratricopeptide (TPR) repeat protein
MKYLKPTQFLNLYLLATSFLPIFFLNIPLSVYAQSEANKNLEKGNTFYKSKKFNDAEVEYRKAIEKNQKGFEGKFNLGDALYKQGKYEDATKIFSELAATAKSKDQQALVQHNLGNSLLKQEKYQESADAFKKSLKALPQDDETRYNLAYALKMIPKQQQQQKQDQQNKDNKKQDQDKKDQQKKDGENKDKENQQADKNDEKSDKKGEQKPQPNQMSEEQAKQMLEALGKNEKEIQDKLKKARIKVVKGKVEKDW